MADRFDSRQFHDCVLESIDFANWRESVSISFLCNAPSVIVTNRRRITFKRVLFFGFEVAVLGEFGTALPLVSVYCDTDTDELYKWRDRINKLAEPSTSHPHGIKSPMYHDVYHFTIDSVWFEGLAILPRERGFQIVCRDYEIT
jgi:hypothetical protein